MNNSGTSASEEKRKEKYAEKPNQKRAWRGPPARRSRPPPSLSPPVSPRAEGVIALSFLSLLPGFYSPPRFSPEGEKIPNPSPESTDPRPRRGPRRHRRRAPAAAGHRTTRCRPFRTRRRLRWCPGKGVRRAFCFLPPHVRDSCFSSFGRVTSCLYFTLRFTLILSLACVIITEFSPISYVGCLAFSL